MRTSTRRRTGTHPLGTSEEAAVVPPPVSLTPLAAARRAVAVAVAALHLSLSSSGGTGFSFFEASNAESGRRPAFRFASPVQGFQLQWQQQRGSFLWQRGRERTRGRAVPFFPAFPSPAADPSTSAAGAVMMEAGETSREHGEGGGRGGAGAGTGGMRESSSESVSRTAKNPWSANDADLLRRRYHRRHLLKQQQGGGGGDAAGTAGAVGEYDYVVVGSGIGGLWLAACLSKFNSSVLVLEQHDIVGGFQHTFRRRGYEFVPGLHYIANLQLCKPLYDMVASTPSSGAEEEDGECGDGDGSDPGVTLPPMPVRFVESGHAVPSDEGQSHTLKVGSLPTMRVRKGLGSAREELLRVFPDEVAAVDEFLAIMERAKWQAGQFATFKIFPKPLQWLLSQLVCSNYVRYASMTTDEVLRPMTKDGRLATVLSAFGGDLGESLAEGSFVMQAAVLGHVLEGCWYPEGGPIQFPRGLVPTIRKNAGDVLVGARVEQVLLEERHGNGGENAFGGSGSGSKYRAVGVRMANGDVVKAKRGVVSDAGIRTTLRNLLPRHVVDGDDGPLRRLSKTVEENSGGISHVFLFVGLNASSSELKLQSSSFYYIPWNETDESMDATAIQDYYRDTLLDPNVLDVSAGMVFVTAKDPVYSETTMPGKSTVIVFSEARAEDFDSFLDAASEPTSSDRRRLHRTEDYEKAKELIRRKMMRSLLLNFPHLERYVDVVEVGTPLTLLDYTLRTETLGLRHTPSRMTNFDIRPDCAVAGLYFTGQDVAFAGWAGALTGAMVAAQRILGYTLLDFAQGKTLMRDLGRGDVEDMIQNRVKEATAASPFETAAEIAGNAVRHIQRNILNPKPRH